MNRKLLLFLALALNACSAFAQDLNAKLPIDPKVIKGKLPNGLTYYIRPNNKPENKVELRLAVNTGSILEDPDQLGLAHFMEHMNFNGTKNFKKNELVNYLQSIGVEFGADLNAYTSFDETVYILPVPTDKPGNLEKGFQIIEDWAHNALLTDKDIDEERGVVLEESRLGKGADQRMMDIYLPKLMAGSRYAERLPIGQDTILKNFKYETIRRFYRDWYRPDLQAVAVVGDIDTATALRLIKKHFAGIKNPGKPKERTSYGIPARTKPEALIVTDKEATNYQLMIIYPAVKNQPEITVADYRNNFIARQLILQMMNRRLSDLARSANPPFPYAATTFDSWARDYENFMAVTSFSQEGPEKSLNALIAELARAEQHGFTQQELDLARKNMLASMEKIYNERNTTESGSYVDEYVRNFLTQEPIPGIENEYNYYNQLLPGITLAELNTTVKKWLSEDNIFVMITGPESADVKLPAPEQLLSMTQKGLNQQMAALEQKQIANSLMSTKPVAGKVVNTQAEKDLGATTYTLGNGIKVTVKSTDFKSDEILLSGVKKGGTNSYGVADKYSAEYAVQVVNAMGIGEFDPTELEKVMAGKNVKVGVGIDDINNSVSGSSTKADIETMFQLLYLRLMQPRKDEALFKAYKDKQKMQLVFLSANPQVAFVDTALSVLYNRHPLAPVAVPKAEYYDAINLDRAIDIYRNELGNADGYHFFIVGNVDEKQLIPLMETYVASIPKQDGVADFKDNGVRPVEGRHRLNINRGKEQQSLIVAARHGQTAYTEDLDLRVNALAEILNIKVIEELREKLGGIYGGGFNADVKREPYSRYSVILQLPCGPENVEKLLTAANAEVEKLKTKGPDKADIDKVKSQWREQHRENMKENGYWAGQLQQILFWGKDPQHTLQYDSWLEKLTADDIKKTAQLVFGGNNEFVAVLYPEESK
jgi:zinc protease